MTDTEPIVAFLQARHAELKKQTNGRPLAFVQQMERVHRAILNDHQTSPPSRYVPRAHCAGCQAEDGIVYDSEPCRTKKLLATMFSSHPDYRAEWALWT